jgi:hypothetical protein
MAVYAVGARTTNAPTATLPAISLYATAAVTFSLLEIGISNTTATACVVGLCRLTTAGTQGTGLTEASLGQGGVAATCTAVQSHTGTAPTLVDLGYRWSLGAAIGSGVIWTFQNGELEVVLGTGNGVGIYCPTGTGQIVDVYMKWMEG